jgi:hypothetical protein
LAKRNADENMQLPPSFPQSFYAVLNRAAKAAGMSRAQFATKAVKFYESALKKRTSTVTKALGHDGAETYTEQARRVSQSWWSKLTPEEKSVRAKKASDARWAKKKKKSK